MVNLETLATYEEEKNNNKQQKQTKTIFVGHRYAHQTQITYIRHEPSYWR